MAPRRNYFKIPRRYKRKANADLLLWLLLGAILIKFIVAFLEVYFWYVAALSILVLIGFWYVHKRKKNMLRMSGIHEIDKMDGIVFENRIKLLYEDMGYTVKKTPASGDFGADLIAKGPGRKLLSSAKGTAIR